MYFRRHTALVLSTLVLAVPALASCGFDYATDRDYTPAAGVHNRDATVDVLNAVIVSAQPGSGTLITTLSNNDQNARSSFDFLAGSGGTTVQVADFKPYVLEPGSFINLADTGGVVISGEFSAGDVVPLTVGFANGERVALQIPVVDDSGYFDGLDDSGSPETEADTEGDTADESTEE